MMNNNIDIYDLDAEKNTLRTLLSSESFAKSTLTYNRLMKEHFTDVFNRDAFKSIKWYYNKYGNVPPERHLKKVIVKATTYIDKFNSKKSQQRFWMKGVERLYKGGDLNEVSIESDIELLERLRKARLVQQVLLKAKKNFEVGEYERIFDDFSDSIVRSKVTDNIVTEGDIVEDWQEHEKIDRDIKLGKIRPLVTNFRAIQETKDLKPKIILVDQYLAGGHYKGEMVLYIGEVNVGKSFQLMEEAINSSRTGINTVLYTIEMQKLKQQRRIYSRISGIPYWKFKQGKLTKQDKLLVRKKLKLWEKKYGRLYVVSFDKGATVRDIEAKHKDVENKFGEKFETIIIDYLNDLKPEGKYASDKNWEAQGEISCELSNLAKFYNNHEGLYVISASQKKTTLYGKERKKAGSGAFSALPEHHATVVIDMGQTDDDEVIGRLRYDITKNREGEKGITYFTFPDFVVGRVNSSRKAKEYYQNFSNDSEDNET